MRLPLSAQNTEGAGEPWAPHSRTASPPSSTVSRPGGVGPSTGMAAESTAAVRRRRRAQCAHRAQALRGRASEPTSERRSQSHLPMTVRVAAALSAPALLSASQTYWPASASCTLVILRARASVTCTRPSGMATVEAATVPPCLACSPAAAVVGPAWGPGGAGPTGSSESPESLVRRHSTSGGGSPLTEQGNSTSAPTSTVASCGPLCRLGGTATCSSTSGASRVPAAFCATHW